MSNDDAHLLIVDDDERIRGLVAEVPDAQRVFWSAPPAMPPMRGVFWRGWSLI